MPRADRTIASTLALSLALSGPLSAQQSTFGEVGLPEGAQSRIDELLAACEETGTIPENLAGSLDLGGLAGELDCDTVQRLAESGAAEASDAEGEAETGAPAEEGSAGEAAEGAAAGGADAAGQATQAPADQAADQATQAPADQAAEQATETPADEAAQEDTQAPAEGAIEAEAAAGEAEAAPQEGGEADSQTDAETQAETGAEAEVQTDAETEAQAEADAQAEAEADAATDADVSEDDLRRALEEGAEATTDETVEEETDAATGAEAGTGAEAQGEAEAEAEADTATDEDAPETTEGPADVAPVDAQEQADALAEDEAATAAAAAAAAEDTSAEAEVSEEVVGEEDVRQSSEDFQTTSSDDERASARADDDDDDDNDNTLRNAALLGLGAVALSEILRGNERVVSNTGDRIVIEDEGQLRVLRNDDVLLRRPGAEVQTYRYDDGSTRQVITYDDGTTVETVRAADGRVLRRTRTLPDGTEVVLFDDTQQYQSVDVATLPQVDDGPRYNFREVTEDDLMAALAANAPQGVNRTFSLNQIRNIDAVRELAPEIAVDTINFPTGSAAIPPSEAQELAALGNAMRRIIERDPDEVFLIEGHTDAVGSAAYNLALSDRRAESVALALTEYFDVPPSNMVLQGYGESDLLVETTGPEVRNRRAAVRRITPLLRQ
ncbi:OmpA family protein [Citreimonas salinaria]|uniref:Outer membrane protein OmpA n=1 Tax=Citreimonas salinaria TaxID=321339 RepID=A0A1H3GBL0_9RHOB|nr:OmpA family protein [Citreimonas salinaria]SDY00435.1 Outer membrane protein OmpA [Citreimonas salinaria]